MVAVPLDVVDKSGADPAVVSNPEKLRHMYTL